MSNEHLNIVSPKLWIYNTLGASVVISVCAILKWLNNFEDKSWIADALIKVYFGFLAFGVAWFKYGCDTTKSMEDWDKIFDKCEPIKSVESMNGLHEGEILQYKLCVYTAQNSMLMHSWFGKAFCGKTGNATALICRSLMGIPTLFKWNLWPFGYAKLKKIKFEGKESIAMQYSLLPVTDHMREYIDENGRECWLGIMVIFGYKLMYFKLYK